MLCQGLLILPFGRPQVYRSEPSELETFGPGDGGVRRPARTGTRYSGALAAVFDAQRTCRSGV